jgi:hypothetical protein
LSKTLVTFLLDRSGSMEAIRDDTIGAFNVYLDTLKDGDGGANGEVFFTLLQFDTTSVDKLHVNQPIKDIPRLTRETFVPRDGTPLIDAACKTIKAVEKSINGGAPKVVICIQTDGQENSSREYTWAQLADLIKEKTAAGWQFNFMGASIDAYDQGARMGIAAGSTMSYDSSDRVATRDAFESSARNMRLFAAGARADTSYSMDQKLRAKDAYVPGQSAKPTGRAKAAKPAPTPPAKSIIDDIAL